MKLLYTGGETLLSQNAANPFSSSDYNAAGLANIIKDLYPVVDSIGSVTNTAPYDPLRVITESEAGLVYDTVAFSKSPVTGRGVCLKAPLPKFLSLRLKDSYVTNGFGFSVRIMSDGNSGARHILGFVHDGDRYNVNLNGSGGLSIVKDTAGNGVYVEQQASVGSANFYNVAAKWERFYGFIPANGNGCIFILGNAVISEYSLGTPANLSGVTFQSTNYIAGSYSRLDDIAINNTVDSPVGTGDDGLPGDIRFFGFTDITLNTITPSASWIQSGVVVADEVEAILDEDLATNITGDKIGAKIVMDLGTWENEVDTSIQTSLEPNIKAFTVSFKDYYLNKLGKLDVKLPTTIDPSTKGSPILGSDRKTNNVSNVYYKSDNSPIAGTDFNTAKLEFEIVQN